MVSDFQPQESYQFFMEEALELLQFLEDRLLGLRQNYSISKIHDLMRTAHSIKGGAACVGLNHIENLAHNLENVFKALLSQDIEIDLELEDLLLQAYDCLRSPLLEEIETGTSDGEAAIEKAEQIRAQIEQKLNSNQEKKADFIDFLFAEEVAVGLSRLETILANEQQREMLEALKAQAEIFRGIGELSHLPGFVAIAQTTIKALETNPQLVSTIGKLAFEDFLAAQVAILAGDRDRGGSPSTALVNLAQRSADVALSDFEPTPKVEDSESPQPSMDITVSTSSQFEPSPSNNTSPRLPSLALGVRMDLSRLELLNNLVGELVTQDNSFLLQNQQHGETLEGLTQCFNRFKKLTQNLQHWSKQIPLDNRFSRSLTESSPATRTQSHFDYRRSYQYLQTSIQTAVEELAQLGEGLQDLALLNQGFQQILKQRQKTLKQVQTNLLQARMLPIGKLLNQFPRMVRDLAAQGNKQVTLQLSGSNTLVDKAVLEKLYDPLVHLVRNAFAHGIEPPQVRQVLGKSSQGQIKISAYHRGNHTYIEVRDDGQGIDLEKIRARAVAMNWLSPTEAAVVSREGLYQYLFTSGFSTAKQVSKLSGRGVGLSAVRLQIGSLKGKIKVTSEPKAGTTFTICLPLTLTIVKLLVFSINGNLLAIPVDSLVSIVLAFKEEINTYKDRQFYQWQGQRVPLCPDSLLSSYHYPRTVAYSKPFPKKDWQTSGKVPLLVLGYGDRLIALKIDQIVMEQDLVIKPFNQAITPPSCLIGCTILGDGRLIPVLDASALIEKWLEFSDSEATIPSPKPVFAVPTLPTIMVVDDSLTMRKTLFATLCKAGYRVLETRDGIEAVEQLKLNDKIDAIICDIEMLRMNGLEFLSRCRELRGKSIPVLMLTSRSSEKYRQLAKHLGATRYLTKPYVDKELLNNLQECISH